MKRFLINGLCLSRNLGGPAMGLTVSGRLRQRYPDCEVRFAAPASVFSTEKAWAEKFGLSVVPRDSLLTRLAVSPLALPAWWWLKRSGAPGTRRFWHDVRGQLMDAYDWADAVINMEGISYVGDGTWSWTEALANYTAFRDCRRKHKPYCRFIQSFGPFDDWRVRFLARRELRTLPFIPARGRQTADCCRRLLPDREVFDTPDVAILLPWADDAWGRDQLARWDLRPGEYTVLSPSSVMSHIPGSVPGSVGARHVESFVRIARALLDRGRRLLFVPHMYAERLRQCDREVCREVIASLPKPAALVEDDIGPGQAKWLIGHARQAVVSRYHAMVAAVSTATAVVPVGWNVKYEDLMDYYGLGGVTIDARQFEPEALAREAVARLGLYDEPRIQQMRDAQKNCAARVDEVFERLWEWIDRAV